MTNARIDSPTEFTKTKMHFALAFLGTLFALHQFVDRWGDNGFRYPYLDFDFKIFYAYGAIAGFLGLTVYFYALAMLGQRGYSWLERIGNLCYAVAIMILPLYAGLYLSNELAERFGQAHLALVAPSAAAGLVVCWLLLSYWLARRMRRQDWSIKIDQLAEHELHALNRAKELFEGAHYDLSVVESWKAIEARLRRVLLSRGTNIADHDPEAVLAAACRAKIVTKSNLEQLHELRRQWEIAVSTEPVTPEAAELALATTRNVLATIPLPKRATPLGT